MGIERLPAQINMIIKCYFKHLELSEFFMMSNKGVCFPYQKV